MNVVLFRHATRSHSFDADNPLNAVGRAQATDLLNLIAPLGPLPPPSHIFVSPKRRAQETMRPLSEILRIHPHVDPRLDERQNNESSPMFQTRVRSLCAEIETLSAAPAEQPFGRPACVFLCSHMDWLELAMTTITSDLSDPESAQPWSTAEFRIFRIQDGLWQFKGRGTVLGRALP